LRAFFYEVSMPDDDTAPTVIQRPILHLPRAKLNGIGVVKRPSGEVRMEEVVEEMKNPQPPEREG